MSTYTTRIRPTGNSLRFGLALKRFIPRINLKRGTLFGFMMFIALIAALTLLPQLLIVFKPFGLEEK